MKDGFRHEHKYLISTQCAVLLKHRLQGVMQRDPYAGPTGQYTIRSLYFDDEKFTAYGEKLDGLRDRIKYRIRFYNYNLDQIRLEKKEKHEELTRKTGERISREEALYLQKGIREGGLTGKGPLMRELEAGIHCGLRPAILVDYDRTPFVCSAGQTRITVDEHIRTRPYSPDLLASPGAMVPVLEDGMAVLEVKYNDFLPGHLSEVLEGIPKVPLAISKYVLCVNTI